MILEHNIHVQLHFGVELSLLHRDGTSVSVRKCQSSDQGVLQIAQIAQEAVAVARILCSKPDKDKG